MGILGVELIDAKGLQGSGRSGKSDVSDVGEAYRFQVVDLLSGSSALRGLYSRWRKGLQIASQEKDAGTDMERAFRGGGPVEIQLEIYFRDLRLESGGNETRPILAIAHR
jgi:hypothetical protein